MNQGLVFSFVRKAIKFVEKMSKQAKSECSFQIAISKAAEARNWQRESKELKSTERPFKHFSLELKSTSSC